MTFLHAIGVGFLLAAVPFVLDVLFESNVRNLVEERGWDKFLPRAFNKVRDRHWFWFVFGALLGGAAMSWVAPFFIQEAAEYPVSKMKTDIRLQFFGGRIQPQEIRPSNNIANWTAYCSGTAQLFEADANGKQVGTGLKVPASCAVFVVFDKPIKYHDIKAQFSDPNAVEIQFGQKTSRSVLVTTTGEMPPGVLTLEATP